jgi:hypothetical protein
MLTVCSEEVGSIHTSKHSKFCSENVKVRVEHEDMIITERWAIKNQSVRIRAGLILIRLRFTGSCDCGHGPLGSIS